MPAHSLNESPIGDRLLTLLMLITNAYPNMKLNTANPKLKSNLTVMPYHPSICQPVIQNVPKIIEGL